MLIRDSMPPDGTNAVDPNDKRDIVAFLLQQNGFPAGTAELPREDAALANAIDQWVGEVLAHRLRAARTRLLDLYAPYGAGASN